MKIIKRYIALLLLLLLTAFGISLAIKSGIGLAAFDAFNQTVADTIGLKVGTIMMFVQTFFVLLQIIILKKEITFDIFLQIPMVSLLGQFINLFVYTLFSDLSFSSYALRLFVFIFSQFWTSFFVGAILVLNLIAMPVENLSLILSKRISFSLGMIRQSIDIILILLSIIITYSFSVPLNIREGTVISAMVFGPMLGFFMNWIKVYFRKWKLID